MHRNSELQNQWPAINRFRQLVNAHSSPRYWSRTICGPGRRPGYNGSSEG
jgi:hypothetical protein